MRIVSGVVGELCRRLRQRRRLRARGQGYGKGRGTKARPELPAPLRDRLQWLPPTGGADNGVPVFGSR